MGSGRWPKTRASPRWWWWRTRWSAAWWPRWWWWWTRRSAPRRALEVGDRIHGKLVHVFAPRAPGVPMPNAVNPADSRAARCFEHFRIVVREQAASGVIPEFRQRGMPELLML